MSEVLCPKCNTAIDADFGMVQCNNCQTVFYIDFSGNIQISEEEVVSAAHQEQEDNYQQSITPNISEFISPTNEIEDFIPQEAQDFESIVSDDFLEESEIDQGEEIGGDWGDIPENEDIEMEEPILEEDNFFQWEESIPNDEPVYHSADIKSESEVEFSQNLDSLSEDVDEASQKSKEALEEIVEFGNSEKSQASTGAFVYSLKLAGIDDGETRAGLKSILSDSKLMLDVEKIFNNFDSGEVVIDDLNPAKLSYIVNSLRPYSLQIRWEQNAIVTT